MSHKVTWYYSIQQQAAISLAHYSNNENGYIQVVLLLLPQLKVIPYTNYII